MRVRAGYYSPLRLTIYGCVAWITVNYFHPEYSKCYNELRQGWWWTPDYFGVQEKEKYRWNTYLKVWDNYYYYNQSVKTPGKMSVTVFDKLTFGKRRFQDPPSYEKTSNHFISVAESTGIDPAKPLLESIRKVVDAYYPADLDSSPEETRKIITPQVRWIHPSDFKNIVEEEEKKPPQGALARMLWYIPQFQSFYDNILSKAKNEEETVLTTLNSKDRHIVYDDLDAMRKMWSQELNDYLPLLAYRWDRKLRLANYLMSRTSEEGVANVMEKLRKPGGVKQLFIDAEIISSDFDIQHSS